MRKLVQRVYSYIQLLRFITFLVKNNPFEKGNPKLSLLVLAKYLSLSAFGYSTERRMGRSLQTSVNLFNVLVNKYSESSSPICLSQALSVLTEEFLNRGGRDGRE